MSDDGHSASGNGHVRVGARTPAGDGRPGGSGPGAGAGGPGARDRAGRGGDGHGGEGGDGPGGEASDQHGLPSWAKPLPALGIALVVLAIGFAGWQVQAWRADEGAVVACGSFRPNPSLWRPADVEIAERGPTAQEIRDFPPPATWASALRETRGTVECAGLVGMTRATVVQLLGEPTDEVGTPSSEVSGLADDERAWSFSRDVAPESDEPAVETTAVVVRFADRGLGRVLSVRTFTRLRVV